MAISAKSSVAAQNGSADSLFCHELCCEKLESLHTYAEARKVHSILVEI